MTEPTQRRVRCAGARALAWQQYVASVNRFNITDSRFWHIVVILDGSIFLDDVQRITWVRRRFGRPACAPAGGTPHCMLARPLPPALRTNAAQVLVPVLGGSLLVLAAIASYYLAQTLSRPLKVLSKRIYDAATLNLNGEERPCKTRIKELQELEKGSAHAGVRAGLSCFIVAHRHGASQLQRRALMGVLQPPTRCKVASSRSPSTCRATWCCS